MSPPMADPCSHDVTLHIVTSARFCGIPHAGRGALFPRHSCREIPADDVTRAPSLRGFPCRPARAHRPGNPLRAFHGQNTWHAARDAPHTRGTPHTRPRGTPHVPNSNNTRHHFSGPRGRLVSDVERFWPGFPAQRRAREGRSLNAERAPYATSCEAGAVATITLWRKRLATPVSRLNPSAFQLLARTHAHHDSHSAHLSTHSHHPYT